MKDSKFSWYDFISFMFSIAYCIVFIEGAITLKNPWCQAIFFTIALCSILIKVASITRNQIKKHIDEKFDELNQKIDNLNKNK